MAVPTLECSITCSAANIKQISRAILQIILFQRALGPTLPRSESVVHQSYPAITDPSGNIDKLVDVKADEIARVANSSGKALLQLSMVERKKSAKWFNLQGDDLVPWEIWKVIIRISPGGLTERERNKIDSVTKQQLSNFMLQVAIFSSQDNSNRMPPITSSNLIPFEYKIDIT